MATRKTAPSVNFDDVPGSLPTGPVLPDVDQAAVAETTLTWLNDLREEYLASNMIWRDILAFTDTYRTFYSPGLVYKTLQKLSKANQRSEFRFADSNPRVATSSESGWLDVNVVFTVQHGSLSGAGAGVVSLTQDVGGQWKIWMLRTWLEGYEGHGNPDEPVVGNSSKYNESAQRGEHVYDVIFVGGGQGGLGAAGRSQALGIDYIIFDERHAIGDSWGDRYDSLKWHTIREYGNLPFGRTFPDEENLLAKDRIAAGYKNWAQQYGINAQEGTQVKSATWDAAAETWTVSTVGVFGDQSWKSRDLVLCIGLGHKNPSSPDWATEEKIKASGFKGTIIHSLQYKNAKAWTGQRGIVVGTANTAHDVAQDMADLGMSTTMLQRSSTFVYPGKWLVKAHSHGYHMDKLTSVADRESATAPNKILREQANIGILGMIRQFPQLFDDMEKTGFKVDRNPDLFTNLYIRFGGHYVDIGSCARIIKGDIKIKTQPVKCLNTDGIEFEDGSKVSADVIVLCTGFNHDLRKDAAEIVGADIANQMDDFWGVDKEGEIRGLSRLAGHPHLYYHGAEVRMARFYSRFLALQLQRSKLGEPLKPYTEGK